MDIQGSFDPEVIRIRKIVSWYIPSEDHFGIAAGKHRSRILPLNANSISLWLSIEDIIQSFAQVFPSIRIEVFSSRVRVER